MKLVMTLLVRDEADIIRENIVFHLEHGVDSIIVTDNGSEDGTRDILDEFERMGVATVIDEPEQNYAQGKWVTRMALRAREELGADWLINNDADEFWHSSSGNLKAGLNETDGSMFACKRRNMVYPCNSEDTSPWHERLVHRIAAPLAFQPLSDHLHAPLPAPYFYLALPPKMLLRTSGLRGIKQGNHGAHFEEETETRPGDIMVYHFPVRTAEQFRRKVTQGGAAYARNTELPETQGWHWRRWHKLVSEGREKEALAEALPDTQRLAQDVRDGTLVRDTTIQSRFYDAPARPSIPSATKHAV